LYDFFGGEYPPSSPNLAFCDFELVFALKGNVMITPRGEEILF